MDQVYKATRTISRFHKDNSLVRFLMGPIGSGKSVGCSVELMRRANEQEAFQAFGKTDQVRKTKWAIVSNTYRELTDTTMETFFGWFPKEMGYMKNLDMSWRLQQKLVDGTILDSTFLFRALDKEDDIKKLLSLDLTGIWLNEARQIQQSVLRMGLGRTGRFPGPKEGGATWRGVIGDTNPPDNDSWIYRLFEEECTKDPTIAAQYKLFKQPSGLSATAENINNLPSQYYESMIPGNTQEWINVYVHGTYGFISDGRPVFPEYKDDLHSTLDNLIIYKKVYIGIDFGLTPAAVFGQITTSGQFQVIDELVTENMGALTFGRLLLQKIKTEYANCDLEIYGDPAGEQRAQTDETTPFQILWNVGIQAFPCYTNDFTIRREAVADYMQRLDFVGKPAFLVGPKAPIVRKGLAGGYKFKRLQVSGESKFQEVPDKGRYSHPCDALQYLMLGAVGGDRVVGGYSSKALDYSSLNRQIT
jgi:hypothetical protein